MSLTISGGWASWNWVAILVASNSVNTPVAELGMTMSMASTTDAPATSEGTAPRPKSTQPGAPSSTATGDASIDTATVTSRPFSPESIAPSNRYMPHSAWISMVSSSLLTHIQTGVEDPGNAVLQT